MGSVVRWGRWYVVLDVMSLNVDEKRMRIKDER